ncbi:MAG: 30S ribosomal protein S6 [Gemmataceae bacterium]
MAANVYECLFILDTGKAGGDLTVVDRTLRTIFERNHAEVLVSRPWDERRLAYPIKNQKKALYYLTYFSAEGTALRGIESDASLTEMVLRMMVLKIHPKLTETMLSIAKGEHATALHNYHEEPGEDGAPTGAPAGGEEGGRRPRREREPVPEKD